MSGMAKKRSEGTNRYLVPGIVVGTLVGVVVYGMTQYPPAIAFGLRFGVVAAIFIGASQK
jgi:hypothetical protein